MFQSTPAYGGRPSGVLAPECQVGVSIHARVRRATVNVMDLSSYATVSIHARVRRATTFRRIPGSCRNVSIHARVRRATVSWAFTIGTRSGFQSTPAYGGRQDRRLKSCHVIEVSIHARVRRATRRWQCQRSNRSRFNPRPRTAGDRSLTNATDTTTYNQSCANRRIDAIANTSLYHNLLAIG